MVKLYVSLLAFTLATSSALASPGLRRIVQRDFDLDARTTFDDHLEAPARGLSGPKEVKHASDGNGAEKLKSDLHAFAGDLEHAEKGKKAQDSEPEARGLFKGSKGVKHIGNGAKNVKSGLQAIKGDLKNAGKGKRAQDSEPEARGLFKGSKGVKHIGNGAKNVKSGLQAIKGDLKNAGKGKRSQDLDSDSEDTH